MDPDPGSESPATRTLTETRPVPVLEGFQPFSHEFLADPFAEFERARREMPVFFYPDLNIWVLTKHADIAAAAPDYKTFSQRAVGAVEIPEQFRADVPESFFTQAFMVSDPPQHTSPRKVANRWFTRSRVAALEPTIRQLADECIDAFVDGAGAELMGDFCYPTSLRVIVSLLDLPLGDAERIGKWAQDLLLVVSPQPIDADGKYDGPTTPLSEEDRLAPWAGLAEGRRYFGELYDSRVQEPREDMASALALAVDADGNRTLTRDQMITHMIELVTAGTDTTANLMADMVRFLSDHPDQCQDALAHPELWEATVEETLRRRMPAIGSFRVTTRDVDVSGTTIPAGSLVMLAWISGGNDEEQFSCPHEFDIHRTNATDHVSFGRGRHFCIGSPVARLEARVAIQRLFERIPELRVVEGQQLEYYMALQARMLRSLQVQWT
jgi:cytochrome P450